MSHPEMPFPVSTVETLFAGKPAADWQMTRPLFVGGVTILDLFFEMRAPFVGPSPSFEWYAEFSPKAKLWFRETCEDIHADGTLVIKPLVRHFEDLSLAPDPDASRDEVQPLESLQHLRFAMTSQFFRMRFRAQLGSEAQVTIYAMSALQ